MTDSAGQKLSRRQVLKRGGTVVTFGMLASAFGALLPRGVRAADSAAGVNALTILYPSGEGLTFNADYYRDHHLVTIMKLYGNTIQRMELRKVNAPPPPPAAAPAAGAAAPPPRPRGPTYAAAINIWINDLAAFQANNQKHGKTMTLVANPDYWGPKPNIAKVVFQFIPETSAEIQAVKTGQVSAAYPLPQTGMLALSK